MDYNVKGKQNLKASLTVPGDKSISHRSVMLGSIATGKTHVKGFLMGEDCISTISCFRQMGIKIEISGTDVTIYGNGLHGLKAPEETLNVGNSGTTIRLLSGILAGSGFKSRLTGDSSIQKRPMDRIFTPLSLMGAKFKNLKDSIPEGKLFAPFEITGSALKGISYVLPVASAQVKSAILLASLYAEGETKITEPEATRDHTEIMLNHMGASIIKEGAEIVSGGEVILNGCEIDVPADISSAAYFMVIGTICKNSVITIKNVGLNPTRTGIITALRQMGANIETTGVKTISGETRGDITVSSSKLKGITISKELIPLLIDEIPVLAVAACFAEGTTIIKDAEELKVKESNRIKAMVTELKKFGADITETGDGMIINGKTPLKGTKVLSYNDHRIAMSLAVLGLACEGSTTVLDCKCVNISFPGFFDIINKL
ncbi:MAG: 3-phosphoshikimate 1-carboxyvinyltransferase [Lachnospiraceae bacterium]|nr:3-phosphoshikimate 1-carboxyvinyltransferase [Lachnospiraceae bacterium]